jgi:hypothetical protein
MDHDAVREVLDLAAAEPGGLDRLMAGDTGTAAAVAAHLVGCDACTAELERLRRVSGLVREVIVTTLPPDLKERTMAHVRAHGVPRSTPAIATAGLAGGAAAPVPLTPTPGRRPAALSWVVAVAAAIVISVVATTLIVGGQLDQRLSAQEDAVRDLAAVTSATLQVIAEPDAARVALESPTGESTSGTLIYSPSTTELVVVASGLVEPPEGMEYGCWVDDGSGRERIGRMFFGGGLAYWIGPSPAVAGSTDATFGVSLVDASGAISGPDPVLVGET